MRRDSGLDSERWWSRRRPMPSDEYVDSVVRSVRGRSGLMSAPRRMGLALAVSLLALVALASVGGIGTAASGGKSAIAVVKKAVKIESAKAPKVKQVKRSAAQDQYEEKEKCNSGRGNLSEGSNAQLINPHTGGQGPGIVPTVDCDPGNSGSHNRGGD